LVIWCGSGFYIIPADSCGGVPDESAVIPAHFKPCFRQ
jgi:hypothetical protein